MLDTKLKNIDENEKAYEEMVKDCRRIKLAKAIAILITAIMVSISLISFKDILENKNIFDERGIYGYEFLGNEIDAFTESVFRVSELYKSEEYIKDTSNLTSEEISWKKEEIKYKIEEEYQTATNGIHEKYSSGNWDQKKIDEEQKVIYKSIEAKYTYTDEELKKLIIEEKLARFSRDSNILNSYENFKFIAYDRGNNIWITNYESGKDAVTKLKEDSGYFAEYHILDGNEKKNININGNQIKGREISEYNRNNGYDYSTVKIELKDEAVSREISYDYRVKSDLDIYISVPKNLVPGDNVYNIYEEFLESNRIVNDEIGIFIGSILGVIVMAFVLNRLKNKPCYLNRISEKLKDNVLEVKLFVLLLGWIAYEMLFRYNWNQGYRYTVNVNNVALVTILLMVYYVVLKSIMQSYKDETILNGSYFIKLYKILNIAMEKGSFGRKLTMLIGAYFVICLGVSFVLCLGLGGVGLVIAIGFCIIVTAIFVFRFSKEFAYLNRITNGAKQIAEGKISEDISEEGRGALKDLAHNINNIKQGLRKSIENENKSEKMKTELISNVSHDLKTPLTSIINYVDLLKRANIEPEEARAYVEVLDKKSQKLKILIEDLFEASKAASGAMQLEFTKVEVNALLRQSLGEAERRIKEANLDFKVNIPKEKIYISADGRKIWRVFENLISNAIKYSLTATRVYLEVKVDEDKVYITMKNISAYELNFDASEITERFKRGEESRHTEGSGLGLAIAKNIVELHGGNLNVEIDGDLFKITVVLDKD
ncbi:MAG: HAMP domain-containing sensor histidine kinase [Clostridium sp.]|uniref:HAMP domain-containing sensor histidine kinase n=1 Tax=Clostridium sp. TaxID=1506 RepID=UPI0030702D3E